MSFLFRDSGISWDSWNDLLGISTGNRVCLKARLRVYSLEGRIGHLDEIIFMTELEFVLIEDMHSLFDTLSFLNAIRLREDCFLVASSCSLAAPSKAALLSFLIENGNSKS